MEILGVHIMFFFIPFWVFGLVAVFCFYSMMGITSKEYRDGGKFFGIESWSFISDFRFYTRGLKDEKKIRKHNRLYNVFVTSAILMIISFLMLPAILLVSDFLNL